MEPTPESACETRSATTSIKRKADEAFDALDDALRPRTDRPSPPKRANSSIYGSLSKYGIMNRSTSPSKTTSTPTLTALLSRARSRKNRKRLPISQYSKTSSALPEYSPGSTDAFLHRLCTFSLSNYPSKPPQIDAVAASKAGWINEGGKDRLYCAICRVGWVVAGRDGLSKDAADALVEKQRQSLVDMHKEGCPWRVRQCDPLVYRIPLQSPTNLARNIKARAAELEPLLDGIAIRHPLNSNQAQIFVQTVSSVPSHISPSPSSSPPSTEATIQPQFLSLSTASFLTSLFGWSLVPLLPPLSRKSSSASLTLARTHSRTSSVQNRADFSREGTPIASGSAIPASRDSPAKTPGSSLGTSLVKAIDSSAIDASPFPAASTREPPRQNDAMLQCQMCQRRIGLWAFAAVPASSGNNTPADPQPTLSQNANSRPQRQLDLLREHRSYCPYVVKSTPLASLPSYPPPPPSSTPRSSFNLTRTSTSSSAGETQGSTSAFNLRRTSSLLSSASSFARTNSPSLTMKPTSSESSHDYNLVEGWRAVYNTVLRYGMSERSRVKTPPSTSPVSSLGTQPAVEHGEKAEDDVMTGVIELVEGVKRHGGKQLLSYVRSLLG